MYVERGEGKILVHITACSCMRYAYTRDMHSDEMIILTESSHHELHGDDASVECVYIGLVEAVIFCTRICDSELGGEVTELQSLERMHCCSVHQPCDSSESTRSHLQYQSRRWNEGHVEGSDALHHGST